MPPILLRPPTVWCSMHGRPRSAGNFANPLSRRENVGIVDAFLDCRAIMPPSFSGPLASLSKKLSRPPRSWCGSPLPFFATSFRW